MQWWYGHNAVAFFLTTPFLGLMYYFLPKAAERPVFSYRLSILHFWSLVFIYIWAGPHHLHYTALPEWALDARHGLLADALDAVAGAAWSTACSRCAAPGTRCATTRCSSSSWSAVTSYGMATFEGPMLSIKCVNALAHYTDWIIAPRARRRARLERLPHLRHALLAGAAAVPDASCYSKKLAERALLDRHVRHPPLLVADLRRPASPRG